MIADPSTAGRTNCTGRHLPSESSGYELHGYKSSRLQGSTVYLVSGTYCNLIIVIFVQLFGFLSPSKCYEDIFSGKWESHDPFRVFHRGHGAMGSKMTFFRAFQGWTALTGSGPGDGTLTLLPNVKV